MFSSYITEFTETELAVASEAMDSYIAMINDDPGYFSVCAPADTANAPADTPANAATEAAAGEAEVNSPYNPRKRMAVEDAEQHTTPTRPRVQRNIMSPFGLSGGGGGGLLPMTLLSPSPNSKILFQQLEDCMRGVSTPLADKVSAMHADPSARLEWSFIEPWTIGRLMQNETKESLIFDVDGVFKEEPRIIVVKLTDAQVRLSQRCHSGVTAATEPPLARPHRPSP